MHILFTRLAPAVALSLPWLALAQQGAPAPTRAPAATLRYQSAFADYKPWQDIKPGDWRQLNDGLTSGTASTGRHAGHADAKPATPPAPAASAPSPAHPGHHRGHHQGHQAHGAQQ